MFLLVDFFGFQPLPRTTYHSVEPWSITRSSKSRPLLIWNCWYLNGFQSSCVILYLGTCIKLFSRGANCSMRVPMRKIWAKVNSLFTNYCDTCYFRTSSIQQCIATIVMGLYVKEVISSICFQRFCAKQLIMIFMLEWQLDVFSKELFVRQTWLSAWKSSCLQET